MRALSLLVIAACGGEATTTTSGDPADKPPAEKPPVPVKKYDPDVPLVADAKLVANLKALSHPSAILWVEDGKIFLGHTGPRWRGELPKKGDVVALDAIERSILEAMVKDGGPAAKEAKFALKYGTPAPPVDPSDTDDSDAFAPGVDKVADYGFKPGQGTVRMAGRSKTVYVAPIPILDSTVPVVVANATVPAGSVAKVLVETGGALAVRHGAELRVLGTGFQPTSNDAPSWVEVHVDTAGLKVLDPGGKSASVDRAGLRAAIEKIAKGDELAIDVLVAPTGVTAQQLVDVLAALGKSARVSLGVLEGTSEARVEKLRSQVLVQGDLGKDIVRRYVKESLPQVRACYDKGLTLNPLLGGTVVAQFFISPTGSVASSIATGVDAKVATCIAEVLKAINFPPPSGGGGVQVTYPFLLRQQS